jgi:hypothetical protein
LAPAHSHSGCAIQRVGVLGLKPDDADTQKTGVADIIGNDARLSLRFFEEGQKVRFRPKLVRLRRFRIGHSEWVGHGGRVAGVEGC